MKTKTKTNNNIRNNKKKSRKTLKKNLLNYNPEQDNLQQNEVFLIHLIDYLAKHSKPNAIKYLDKLEKNNCKNQPHNRHNRHNRHLHFIITVNTPHFLQKYIDIDRMIRNKKIRVQNGGVYLLGLENKGEQPITGNDLNRALDEISSILTRLQYTPKGSGLKSTNLIMNLLRGDQEALRNYVKIHEIPKYVSYLPPSLNLTNILNDIDQIPDLYGVYKQYMNDVNQYKVETGELDPKDIKPDKFEQLAEKLVAAKYAIEDIKDPVGYAKARMMYG